MQNEQRTQLVELMARASEPSLWGNPFAYPEGIESDHDLQFARRQAIGRASKALDALLASPLFVGAADKLTSERKCSCAEVHGEDPRCILHGTGTEWRKANPDICELAERVAGAEAKLALAVEALEPFLNCKDQFPETVKAVNLAFDGLAPITITVTKAQFLRASATLAKIKEAS